MAIPQYLAMTAAEMAGTAPLPRYMAWMACHFSPYSTGLTNLPAKLHQGSLLILNDRTPIHCHDPERVCRELNSTLHRLGCVGLLSTSGTVRARIYEPYFEALGIDLLHPTEVGVQNLMYLIYDEIKAGRTPHPERLYPEIMALEQQGAQAFLLACTELPLVFHDGGRVPFIDPTRLLARAAVAAAGGKLKEE